MLLVDSLLYLLITLYVEKVLPGDYGVPEPWYFPFSKKFWLNIVDYQGEISTQQMLLLRYYLIFNFLLGIEDVHQDNHSSENIEQEPVGKEAGIKVKGLRKMYSNKKVAVQGLTLNMYEDQITVLLGHNGAGKTTTMSMLTGMIPPTAGSAMISGKDIRKDIEKVRGSLGLCPQHNILFDELTVREHIEFYSRLKGMKKNATNGEVQKYVALLQLENKVGLQIILGQKTIIKTFRFQIDKQSKTLSGGMQRKLSVGVALCAGSKVVLCDEPTSGIDPAARRALWDLLLQEKKGRTILLSTHFMDEADILGDRIAIMAEGELKAVGSSFFLKKKFGVGYRLVCVKEAGCVTADVTSLLKKYIPDAAIKTNIGSELSYQLKDENVGVFQEMLEELEANSQNLKLLNYGISLTTMEEVFMKVGSDYTSDENDDERPKDLQNGHSSSCKCKILSTQSSFKLIFLIILDDNFENPPLLSGAALISNQIIALFKKRMYHTYRNWVLYLLQNIIPVIFLVLTISIVRTWRGNDDLPPFKLNLEQYNPTVTLMQSDGNMTSDSFEYK
jgi:ATP-binding cassette, subfamily A (ABC1), member 3